jgi:uncharacterized protein YgbK (DUF1537 family)
VTPPPLFASVADDDTGASDLAGMFADQGVRALLVLDPSLLDGGGLTPAEVIVLATASRALPKERAYDVTAEAVRRAAALGARSIQIKYCSTFDSTAEGNIGPSLDAALDALDERFTIAVPALPVNGRTTYLGHHFVKGQLLSDSPMRHHPLTPMTNANLVAHLQRQTARRVGLTPCPVVEAGPAAILDQWTELRAAGIEMAIVDCISESQAASIAEAAAGLRLISGSSVFGAQLPSVWRRRGWLSAPTDRLWDGLELDRGRGRLVAAGSCSVATAAQNAWIERAGATVLEADARDLAESGPGLRRADESVCPTMQAKDMQSGGAGASACQPILAQRAVVELAGGGTVLLKTHSTAEAIAAAQQWGAQRGWSPAELGMKIAAGLARLVAQIVAARTPEALICAGGETTGAICRALEIRGFAVGRNIQPGVPLCFPLEGLRVPMVLKSGNFGTEDFYGAAFQAAREERAGLKFRAG